MFAKREIIVKFIIAYLLLEKINLESISFYYHICISMLRDSLIFTIDIIYK